VQGFGTESYGESFADIYDDWYAEISDTDGTVAFLTKLAEGRRVLELGIGTGRLALPLTEAGLAVSGVDASAPMIELLRAKPGGDAIEVVQGDMAEIGEVAPPRGTDFGLVFIAFNTFFNITSEDAQQRCLEGVARRLEPGGRFVLEAYVPGDDPGSGEVMTVRSMEVDRVVLSISRRDPSTQTATGQYVELSEKGGVRLRPWMIRYAAPTELDQMAGAAGLRLVERWAGWRGEQYSDSSTHHVSIYELDAAD
jgi:SAM-dependent methyltransferase